MKTFVVILLQENKITTEGAYEIASYLSQNPCLQVLHVEVRLFVKLIRSWQSPGLIWKQGNQIKSDEEQMSAIANNDNGTGNQFFGNRTQTLNEKLVK